MSEKIATLKFLPAAVTLIITQIHIFGCERERETERQRHTQAGSQTEAEIVRGVVFANKTSQSLFFFFSLFFLLSQTGSCLPVSVSAFHPERVAVLQ